MFYISNMNYNYQIRNVNYALHSNKISNLTNEVSHYAIKLFLVCIKLSRITSLQHTKFKIPSLLYPTREEDY